MTGNDKDNKDLNDFMAGTDGLSEAYQQNATEIPPGNIDETILAASRKAVNSRLIRAKAPFSTRWHVPASLAAVVVLSVLVVFNLPDESDQVFFEPALEERMGTLNKSMDMIRNEAVSQGADVSEIEVMIDNTSSEEVSLQPALTTIPQSDDMPEFRALARETAEEMVALDEVQEESNMDSFQQAPISAPVITRELNFTDQTAALGQSTNGRQMLDDSESNTVDSDVVSSDSIEIVVTAQRRRQLTECTTPRPEVCAEIYMPVCAVRDTGIRCVTTPCDSTERVDYPNACSACSDSDVMSYTEGLCEVPENEEDQL